MFQILAIIFIDACILIITNCHIPVQVVIISAHDISM